MYRQNGLLSFAFDGNETCLWLLSSSADRSRIGRISLVPKYEGAYRAGRYEPHLMSKCL